MMGVGGRPAFGFYRNDQVFPLMHQFTEEYANLLLSKEWLVKTDPVKNTPFLLKYHHSVEDDLCFVVVTDTKSVWSEVLQSKQVARRWRECNPQSSQTFSQTPEEGSWRKKILQLISNLHTLGGFTELSFDSVESQYADFAFELENENFKWRWETCFLGYQRSAEIISKHLIFPLISVSHMAFTSTTAIGEIPDNEVEKAVDKVSRVARRTVDTHIKNALSRPRTVTTLRRMTAMFNFIPDLPPVISEAGQPDLKVPDVGPRSVTPPPPPVIQSLPPPPRPPATTLSTLRQFSRSPSPPPIEAPPKTAPIESATESEDDDPPLTKPIPTSRAGSSQSQSQSKTREKGLVKVKSPPPRAQSARKGAVSSDSDSSPHRPVKKAKPSAPQSSDEDSEEERKRRLAELKAGGSSGNVKRGGGTRQPIKRGGKRF